MICLSDLPGNEKSSQPPESLERALSGVVTGKMGRFSLFGKIADDYVSFAFHDVVDLLTARETATAAAEVALSEKALHPA
jgi:hypothetical protein